MKFPSFLNIFFFVILFGSCGDLLCSQTENHTEGLDNVSDITNQLTDIKEQVKEGNVGTEEVLSKIELLTNTIEDHNNLLEQQQKNNRWSTQKVILTCAGVSALTVGSVFFIKMLLASSTEAGGVVDNIADTSSEVVSDLVQDLSSSANISESISENLLENEEARSALAKTFVMLMTSSASKIQFIAPKLLTCGTTCVTKVTELSVNIGLQSILTLMANPKFIIPLYTIISTKAWNRELVKDRIPESVRLVLDKGSDKLMALLWGESDSEDMSDEGKKWIDNLNDTVVDLQDRLEEKNEEYDNFVKYVNEKFFFVEDVMEEQDIRLYKSEDVIDELYRFFARSDEFKERGYVENSEFEAVIIDIDDLKSQRENYDKNQKEIATIIIDIDDLKLQRENYDKNQKEIATIIIDIDDLKLQRENYDKNQKEMLEKLEALQQDSEELSQEPPTIANTMLKGISYYVFAGGNNQQIDYNDQSVRNNTDLLVNVITPKENVNNVGITKQQPRNFQRSSFGGFSMRTRTRPKK